MIGAIAGDIIGSVHEIAGTKTKDFPLFTAVSTFTDDTVLTVAVAVHLAWNGREKSDIKRHIERDFGYHLDEWLDDIRQRYTFDVSCQGSVPQSIIAFLESESYEDAVRNAISLGGDADTMACIAGAIAEGYYGGVPGAIQQH
jgi:ADP-ribosylglycohydrolase